MTVCPQNLNGSFFFPEKPPPPPLLKRGGRGDLEKMAEILWRAKKVPVLIKGGHLKGKKVEDLFFDGTSKTWFMFQRMVKKKIRGTGCALATLIACFCAEGFPVSEAVRQARLVMQKWLQSRP